MSLPRYPAYKDSGVEWIGSVPVNWEVGPLKRLLDLQNGADHKAIETDEGVPVIGSGGAFAFASMAMFDGESVLLGRKGTIDRPIYVNGPFWTVDTMYWSKVNPGVSAKFAYYAATTIPFGYYSTNTALPSMTKAALNAHAVACPAYDEQSAIAAFLDSETAKIDALIAEQARLLELLSEKRQAVIAHAVTKGLNPDAPMKDSDVAWLGEVPAHWEVARLATLYREVNEPGSDDRPTLSVSIHDGVSDDEIDEADSERKITRSEDKGKYKRVEPNDLTYNMMRAWQGAFGTVTVSGQVSPAYVVARPRAIIETGFIEALLRTPKAKEQIRRYSRGITDFRLRLYWGEFKELRVGVPPHEEQVEILASIDQMNRQFDELQSAAESLIELLAERRSALIAAAVTGQIDVREAA